MRQASGEIQISTHGKGLIDVTRPLHAWLNEQKVQEGVLTVFIRHSSASLTIQENADPDVQLDLADYFERIAPESWELYRHNSEGLDDMPAHIRSALTDVSLTIPVLDGRMRLGTWQGVYVFEHRASPHIRKLALNFMGD